MCAHVHHAQTLANNAAKDATDLVATLRAYHNAAQTDPTKSHLRWYGMGGMRWRDIAIVSLL